MTEVHFGVLGPLLVVDGGVSFTVAASQPRRLLGALLARAGRVVSFDELADQLWDGAPPPGARATLRNYVKVLRQQLGPRAGGRLITRAPGYLVDAHAGELDSARFALLLRRGREAAREQRWEDARTELTAALAMWRGEAFADMPLRSIQEADVPRLNEMRLTAYEWRIEADLHLGRHDGLAGELRRLIDQHPFRERLTGLLMLALYRAGRQSEALAAFRATRTLLRDEVGVEPGPALGDLQRRILAADPGLIVGATAPAQLPPGIRGFAGRDAELTRLDAMLVADGDMTVVTVSGTAGVGKTALALRWAHRIAGRFPDGQLFVDLHGFDGREPQVTPEAALRGLLEALGHPPAEIPLGLAALAGLYRSALHGRRVLVLVDNARDEGQVRPLLPGTADCLVIVTSRSRLTGLVATAAARPLAVELLDEIGARQLLIGRIGADRVAAETDAVHKIISRCAGLPLALAVVAARAVINPAFPLSALAAELARDSTVLDAFSDADPASNLRAAFSCSYRSVSKEAAQVFRLLGRHPGRQPAGMPPSTVQAALAELTSANLLREYRPGRYTMHGLLRAYAAELFHRNDELDRYLHDAHQDRRRQPLIM